MLHRSGRIGLGGLAASASERRRREKYCRFSCSCPAIGAASVLHFLSGAQFFFQGDKENLPPRGPEPEIRATIVRFDVYSDDFSPGSCFR